MKTLLARAAAIVLVAAGLGGCAVYGPPPDYGGYYGAPAYGYGAPAYGYAAPGYYDPAPVYWGPPVSFGFSFGYWGGGGHHHHHRR